MEYIDHLRLDLRRECQMCTFGTGYPAVSREGENPMNALKNCAKTAAKINVRQVSELDEFQHIRSGYLEFYTNRAHPPSGDDVKAFQAGCDGYVAKPFDPRTLLAAIRTHLA